MKSIKGIKAWLWRKRNVLRRAACAAVLFMEAQNCHAQAAVAESAEGKVTRFTTAPKGEIDGAILDDGTWIHWPPHMEDVFASLVTKGDTVRATGRTETTPKGDVRFEIKSITNSQTKASAENRDYDFGPPPRGPRGRGKHLPPHLAAQRRRDDQSREEQSTVQGTVKQMTTAPRGEIDGALLSDGTILHWPPHLQDQFTGIVKVGAEIQATGRVEKGPRGDTHFEVRSASNSRINSSVENRQSSSSSQAGGERSNYSQERNRRIRELERQVEQLQRTLKQLGSED